MYLWHNRGTDTSDRNVLKCCLHALFARFVAYLSKQLALGYINTVVAFLRLFGCRLNTAHAPHCKTTPQVFIHAYDTDTNFA